MEGRGAYVREGGASADTRINCAEFSETDAVRAAPNCAIVVRAAPRGRSVTSALRVRIIAALLQGLVIVGSASHNTPDTNDFVAAFKEPAFMQLGSSLKLLLIAEGSPSLARGSFAAVDPLHRCS